MQHDDARLLLAEYSVTVQVRVAFDCGIYPMQ